MEALCPLLQGNIAVMQLDLASLRSVHAFATKFQAKYPRLDLLVLNAGVMACPKRTTEDGFELQIGTSNYPAAKLSAFIYGPHAALLPSTVWGRLCAF